MEKALSDGKQDIRKMCDLKLISLRWMFQDGKEFSDLVSEFKKLERPAWFGHEFISALFKTNWQHAQKYIIYLGLCPFMLYFSASLMYSIAILSVDKEKGKFDLGVLEIGLYGIPMSLCWLYFTYQEVRQFIINAREVSDREKGCC